MRHSAQFLRSEVQNWPNPPGGTDSHYRQKLEKMAFSGLFRPVNMSKLLQILFFSLAVLNFMKKQQNNHIGLKIVPIRALKRAVLSQFWVAKCFLRPILQAHKL